MSLKGFFKENAIAVGQVEKFVVSERFTDEEGKPLAWELKALSPKRWAQITTGTWRVDENGAQADNLVGTQFQLIAEVVKFPNLRDVELQDSYHVQGVESLLDVMLTSGEFQRLMKKVNELHKADKKLDEIATEVKND